MFQPDGFIRICNMVILWSLLFLGVHYCTEAMGAGLGEYKLLDIDRLDVEYSRLDPDSRDPYAPRYTGRWKERAALKWDVSILKYLFWRNNVHTEIIDTGQVKTVGWEWEAGIPLGRYFEIYHHHHSRHIMDEPKQVEYYRDRVSQFPVEDSVVLRIKFINREK